MVNTQTHRQLLTDYILLAQPAELKTGLHSVSLIKYPLKVSAMFSLRLGYFHKILPICCQLLSTYIY